MRWKWQTTLFEKFACYGESGNPLPSLWNKINAYSICNIDGFTPINLACQFSNGSYWSSNRGFKLNWKIRLDDENQAQKVGVLHQWIIWGMKVEEKNKLEQQSRYVPQGSHNYHSEFFHLLRSEQIWIRKCLIIVFMRLCLGKILFNVIVNSIWFEIDCSLGAIFGSHFTWSNVGAVWAFVSKEKKKEIYGLKL